MLVDILCVFIGPACNQRQCPIGYDPIYTSRSMATTRRYSSWSYTLHTTSPTANISGKYALTLYDVFDEDWTSDPISADANCDAVIKALTELPNNVVKQNTVRCIKELLNPNFDNDPVQVWKVAQFYGVKFTLSFPMNPGRLSQLSVNMYLDGSRPSIYPNEDHTLVKSFVYPNSGVQGETTDYFSNRCDMVLFKLREEVLLAKGATYNNTQMMLRKKMRSDWINNGDFTVMYDLNFTETIRLKKCLSLSGGGVGNPLLTEELQGQKFTWEAGTQFNPHIVRIVPVNRVNKSSDLFRSYATQRKDMPYDIDQSVLDDFPEYRY